MGENGIQNTELFLQSFAFKLLAEKPLHYLDTNPGQDLRVHIIISVSRSIHGAPDLQQSPSGKTFYSGLFNLSQTMIWHVGSSGAHPPVKWDMVLHHASVILFDEREQLASLVHACASGLFASVSRHRGTCESFSLQLHPPVPSMEDNPCTSGTYFIANLANPIRSITPASNLCLIRRFGFTSQQVGQHFILYFQGLLRFKKWRCQHLSPLATSISFT